MSSRAASDTQVFLELHYPEAISATSKRVGATVSVFQPCYIRVLGACLVHPMDVH